jgi:hypothetical protein
MPQKARVDFHHHCTLIISATVQNPGWFARARRALAAREEGDHPSTMEVNGATFPPRVSLRFTACSDPFRQVRCRTAKALPCGVFNSSNHSIMDIQIATLCDFAADYNGKLVISGTFDTLAARAVPVVHPSCALAMRFCFTPEDAGRHKLSINIINEDGEPLDPNNMPIEPEFEVALPKNVPFLTRNIVMNLQGLRFPESGIYSIDIGCDGEILVRLPLRIVQVTQGPNGEQQMS